MDSPKWVAGAGDILRTTGDGEQFFPAVAPVIGNGSVNHYAAINLGRVVGTDWLSLTVCPLGTNMNRVVLQDGQGSGAEFDLATGDVVRRFPNAAVEATIYRDAAAGCATINVRNPAGASGTSLFFYGTQIPTNAGVDGYMLMDPNIGPSETVPDPAAVGYALGGMLVAGALLAAVLVKPRPARG